MVPDVPELRSHFASLHESGMFVMPNAWDVGSAKLFQSLGFQAIATTSSGFAGTLGRHDQNVSRDELVDHVGRLVRSVAIPVSVDSEDGYSESLNGLTDTVDALADAGAAGVSIEDYRPDHGLLDITVATERVGVFVEAANRHGIVVTARAENHLYGVDDLDDTIERLGAYADAGAHVVYAPGLIRREALRRVVAAVDRPVNALLVPPGPTVAEMGESGVRRLSTGGALTWVGYGAVARAARELMSEGTQTYATGMLSADDRDRAFGS